MCLYPLVIHLSDLPRVLTQDLGKGIYWDWRTGLSREGFEDALGQVFQQDIRTEEVRTVTEKYHTYKRNYVKHISFNPGKENFSKCIFDSIRYNFTLNFFVSSFRAHTCATSASVHLLWLSNLWWDWKGPEGGTIVRLWNVVYTNIFVIQILGYNGGPIRTNRRHNGPAHWLFHP